METKDIENEVPKTNIAEGAYTLSNNDVDLEASRQALEVITLSNKPLDVKFKGNVHTNSLTVEDVLVLSNEGGLHLTPEQATLIVKAVSAAKNNPIALECIMQLIDNRSFDKITEDGFLDNFILENHLEEGKESAELLGVEDVLVVSEGAST